MPPDLQAPMESYTDVPDIGPQPSSPPPVSTASLKTPVLPPQISALSASQAFLSPQPSFSGPSHQYDLYKQQTGLVPGAVASTLAINQANNHISASWDLGLGSRAGSYDEVFDFNTLLPCRPTLAASDLDFGHASPGAETPLFSGFPVSPLPLDYSPLGLQPSAVGRMWPGIHLQNAMAKERSDEMAVADAEKQQQTQQQEQDQRPQQEPSQQHQQKQQQNRVVRLSSGPMMPKAHSPEGFPLTKDDEDALMEQKITQVLNKMRANPSAPESGLTHPTSPLSRHRKDMEEMDQDERLLASEEGKKLSTRERRQLRNKVSARAFRSRRKEYISQLESEISGKAAEIDALRVQNRALMNENKMLSDLTHMLLASPAFSEFLDQLTCTPQGASGISPPPQVERPQPKDVNPSAEGAEHVLDTAISEPTDGPSHVSAPPVLPETFTIQPQVYNAVLKWPGAVDLSLLSGKPNNIFLPGDDDQDDADASKNQVISECADPSTYRDDAGLADATAPRREVGSGDAEEGVEEVGEEDAYEDDDPFDLYSRRRSPPAAAATHSSPSTLLSLPADDYEDDPVPSEKAPLGRYELVDSLPRPDDQAAAEELAALLRIERAIARIDAAVARAERF